MTISRIDRDDERTFFCDIKEFTNNYYCEKKKVYFAGPWFDERANYLYNNVKDLLDKFKNLDVYYPVEHTAITPKKTYNDNVKQIENADLVIALIDRKDTGTAWEIGLSQGLKKDLLLLAIDEDSFKSSTNIMLAFCGKAILLKNLVNYLITNDEKYLYKVKNTWEGKQ